MKDIASILSKVDAEEMLTKEDAVTLLNIDNQSKVFYELIAVSYTHLDVYKRQAVYCGAGGFGF